MQGNPSPISQETVPDGRDIIRKAFQKLNINQQTTEVLIQSISPSTLNQYCKPISEWAKFCLEHDINVSDPETGQVLTWLSQLFSKGASYATMNTARSALSFIMGEKIGKNQYVCRFLKGVYQERPTKPKYNKTYDLDPVLIGLGKMYPLEKLELPEITVKLVVLLSLVTGHRRQTISLIKLNNIRRTRSGVEIEVPDKIKTSRPGAPQPLLVLPRFVEKPELCVVQTLEAYLAVTKKLRNCDNLFISTRQPFGAASRDTISRWVRSFLAKCGITDYAPHSLRHASTSAAWKRGVKMNMINSLAGWSDRSNIFNKFYNRPIIEDSSLFARAVVLNEKA